MCEAGSTELDTDGWLSVSRSSSPLGLCLDPGEGVDTQALCLDNGGPAPETMQTAAAGAHHCAPETMQTAAAGAHHCAHNAHNAQTDEVILMQDRSYRAKVVQEWIFGQHEKYRSSCDEVDVEVYGSNLSYFQNSARKLTTSDELPQKAYMVDTTPKGAMSPKFQQQPSGSRSAEPSTFNALSIITSMKLLDSPQAPGDQHSRLIYIECGWTPRTRKRASEWIDGGGADADLNEDDRDPEKIKNPDQIKVWGFYYVSGGLLTKVKELTSLSQTERRAKSKELHNFKNELGPVLYIVLPSDDEPVTRKRALCTLLSEDVAEQLLKRCNNTGGLSPADSAAIAAMLKKLNDEPWPDWVQEEDFIKIKPTIAALWQFTYTNKHLPGVQSASVVERGEFDEKKHCKAMLMYTEIFLQFLYENSNKIGKLESEILILKAREKGFFDPAAEDEAKRLDSAERRADMLRQQTRSFLRLRGYQQEAVEVCLAGNTIINLATGKGKTLIAVKIIDYVMQRHEGKNILFIVPTKALVPQQAQYIKDHSICDCCTVSELCGMDMTAWDAAAWDSCKRSSKVLVGTAEVFRTSLVDRGFMKVAEISLCIFDECHNATKNNPMARILSDAVNKYSISEDERPRIIGLTASFVNGKCENLISKRRTLESLLQARMWVPSKENPSSEEDRKFIRVDGWAPPKYNDRLELWAQKSVQEYLRMLSEYLPILSTLNAIVTCGKAANSAAHVLVELGVPAFIYYLEEGILPELEAKAHQQLQIQQGVSPSKQERLTEFCERLPIIRKHMKESARRLKESADMSTLDLQTLHPLTEKASRLIELLATINSKTVKKGIVFVTQIALVYPLANLCRQKTHLVGEVSGGSSMTDKDRNKALKDFKSGEIKLLVATAALEEGIDVADCEFVIRFNKFDTTKSHIQGSGRARALDAELYYFENDVVHEQEMAARLTEIASDNTLALSPGEARTAQKMPALPFAPGTQDYPYHPPGEAEVNLSNAGKLVQQYCAAVMKRTLSKKQLCHYKEEITQDVQCRKTLLSVRYPTPAGWKEVKRDKNDAEMMHLFRSSDAEIVRNPDFTNAKSAQRIEKSFFWVVAVLMRKQGLLDSRNKATGKAKDYTSTACFLPQEELKIKLRPKFNGREQRVGGPSSGGLESEEDTACGSWSEEEMEVQEAVMAVRSGEQARTSEFLEKYEHDKVDIVKIEENDKDDPDNRAAKLTQMEATAEAGSANVSPPSQKSILSETQLEKGGDEGGGGGRGERRKCVSIKLSIHDRMYRISVEDFNNVCDYVKSKSSTSTGTNDDRPYDLTYVDCDGDTITISSESEFQDAVTLAQASVLKLSVKFLETHLI